VRCLHWIEVRAGWQSGFNPDAARSLFGTLARALFTFMVFFASSRLFVVPLASAQRSQGRNVGDRTWQRSS
jgi:hypothetical protein